MELLILEIYISVTLGVWVNYAHILSLLFWNEYILVYGKTLALPVTCIRTTNNLECFSHEVFKFEFSDLVVSLIQVDTTLNGLGLFVD